MDPATKEIIELAVKHLSDRIAMAFILLTVLALAICYFIPPLRLWMQANPVWVFLAAAWPVCFLVARPLADGFGEWNEQLRDNRKKERELLNKRERLHHLLIEEKRVLKLFQRHGFQSLQIPSSDAGAQSLQRDHVLSFPAIQPSLHGIFVYNIESWAAEYITENPKLLD